MKNYSQNNEQQIILDYIQKTGMTQGKLLEIGAFDGETFSNTRAIMLQYPDWKGVFVEPSSFCFVKLYEMYKSQPSRAELVNLAVVCDDEVGNNPLLAFYESPMSASSSSVEGHNLQFGHNEKNEAGESINPRKIYVGKIGMKSVLDSFGLFDLINIDVEGYSAKLALQDWFNPNDYGCKILCIEMDGMWRELQQKFLGQGYGVLSTSPENIIFAKVSS